MSRRGLGRRTSMSLKGLACAVGAQRCGAPSSRGGAVPSSRAMWFLATLKRLRRDQRREQLLESQVAKSWRRNSVRERLRNLRLDRLLRVEQEQSLVGVSQDGVGQAIAGAEQFLLLALVTLAA